MRLIANPSHKYTETVNAGMPADSLAGLPSAHLGKYQLIRRLATGGMAELFLARATALHGFEKLVVLKRILPQHAESEDFIRMFLAEARLAATLHHPNIVQVYDIGEEQGAYFFTMEYVQGQDLRKLVRAARKKSVPIPIEHVLHIIAGVAAGLNHAHEKVGRDGQPLGIVHRDVSPSNVLVTYEGGVKIVDFGIAKAATAQVNTIAGTLKGKIPYMSPEQCRGEGVDRRSDIFSIGTLLWEMTTGSRLFAGDNEFAILNRVAKGDVPPPSSIRPDYPPELEAIVMRALQADPTQRYETALDMQIDLEDFAREARLPVSSARMSKFMRELFAEEIQKANQQLQNDTEDVQTMPQPVLAPASMAGASQSMDANVEYTPSEVRVSAGLPTPGPSGSETGIVQHSEPIDTLVPGQTRPAVAVAVIALLLGVVGAGAAGYSMLTDEDDAAVTDKKKEEPRIEVVEMPTPPPDPQDDPVEDDEEVEIIDDEPTQPEPAMVPALEAPIIEDPPPEPPPTEPEPESAVEDPAPPVHQPKGDRPKGDRKGTGKVPVKKPPKKPPKTGTKDSPTEPKWDPSSPLPSF